MRDGREAKDHNQCGAFVIHEELIETAFVHVHAFLNVLNHLLDLIETLLIRAIGEINANVHEENRHETKL